eukprot:14042269-Ditylum_brightwellii.AAC.1
MKDGMIHFGFTFGDTTTATIFECVSCKETREILIEHSNSDDTLYLAFACLIFMSEYQWDVDKVPKEMRALSAA